MKFCLYDFFEEGTVEIGRTDWIDKHDKGSLVEDVHFTNEHWDFFREVLVEWPTTTNSVAGKHAAKAQAGNSPKYVARVVFFADDCRDSAMLEKCKKMTADCTADHSNQQTTSTRLGRVQKRPQRFSSSDEEEEAAASSGDKRQLKQKKAKVVAAQSNALLARLAKKEATKKIEQGAMAKLRAENKSLKDELQKVEKERDSLVAGMACLKELPALLGKNQDCVSEVKTPLSKGQSSATVYSPTSPHSLPTDKKPARAGSMKPAATAPTKVIQEMMLKVFTREQMATHSLTGSSSNANGPGKKACPQIDATKMEDIFKTVQARFPDIPNKVLREAARNKLSNERKLFKRTKVDVNA